MKKKKKEKTKTANRFHILNMLEKFPPLRCFTAGAQGA